MNLPTTSDTALITEVTKLIHSAKQQAVVAVNAELTLLYWQVGRRIAEEVFKGERAEYGQQIIENLARDLTTTFGRGWQKKQLLHCLRFAECYSETEIVSAVRRQLNWPPIKSLIYINNPLKREFYMNMAVQERWSPRCLPPIPTCAFCHRSNAIVQRNF